MNKKAQCSLNYLAKQTFNALFYGKGPFAQYTCADVYELANWLELLENDLRNYNYKDIDWIYFYNKLGELELGNIEVSQALDNFIKSQVLKYSNE